jgi:hypothetical protein
MVLFDFSCDPLKHIRHVDLATHHTSMDALFASSASRTRVGKLGASPTAGHAQALASSRVPIKGGPPILDCVLPVR